MKQPGLQTSGVEGIVSTRALAGKIERPWLRSAALYRAIALALAFGGILALRIPLEVLAAPTVYRKDLIQEYLLGQAALHRANPYAPITELAVRFLGPLPNLVFPHPTPHPPTVVLIAAPLALLSYRQAAAVWLIFEVLCLAASAYLVLAESVRGPGHPAMVLLAVGAALILSPFNEEIAIGQLMIPLLLLVVLAWRSLRRGQNTAAGIFLGLSVALKFITWPLLLFLVWRKNWKGVRSAIGAAIAANLVALAAFGPATMMAYYLKVLPFIAPLYRASGTNISLSSIGWRLFAGTGRSNTTEVVAAPLIASPLAAAWATWLLPLGLLVVVALLLRRIKSWESAFGLLICASILVSPISWSHYRVLLGLPMCLTALRLAAPKVPPRVIVAAVLTCLLMGVPASFLHLLLWRFSSMQTPLDQSFAVPPAAGLILMVPVIPVFCLMWILWILDQSGLRLGGKAA